MSQDKAAKSFYMTSSAVTVVKGYLHIDKPNNEMTDEEIRKVCRWFGEHAPDYEVVNGVGVFGREGIEAMMFIALTEFPSFYTKYELSPID